MHILVIYKYFLSNRIIINSKGRLLSILVVYLLCSRKFYVILSTFSKNVIELNVSIAKEG
jgi:hypothetical protein